MQEGRIRSALPVHPVPDDLPDPGAWRLRIEGRVVTPLDLTLGEVVALGIQDDTSDFACEEGWVVPDQRWEGVPVAAVLQQAGLHPDASFVRVHARNFTVVISLEEILMGGALLASRLNDAPLSREHGAPLRLIASGRACFYQVKWVDRLEVLAQDAPMTGATIALGRLTRGRGTA